MKTWLTSDYDLFSIGRKLFSKFNLYYEKAEFLMDFYSILDHCAWIKSDNTSIDERIPDIVTVVFDKYFKSDSTFLKFFFDIF